MLLIILLSVSVYFIIGIVVSAISGMKCPWKPTKSEFITVAALWVGYLLVILIFADFDSTKRITFEE